MPGAANALAARVIEATGHKMLMVSGAAVANTFLGAPDIGLVSLAELAAHVGAIRDAVNIPLLVDVVQERNPVNDSMTNRIKGYAGANLSLPLEVPKTANKPAATARQPWKK